MSKKFSIATWNVNSVRTRMHAISNWIKDNQTDIILLQETKCVDNLFPEMELQSMGYNVIMFGEKSYNGVAILSKLPISIEMKELPLYEIEDFDKEARYIEGIVEVDSKVIRVASVYVPNGSSNLEEGETIQESKRFKYKTKFLERLKRRLKEVSEFEDEIVIFGGDYNVAHKDIDLISPKSANGQVGFLPEEKALLEGLLSVGYQDAFRHFNPDLVEYTWWNYKYGAWQKNYGWRIDYLLANSLAMEHAEKCHIVKDTRAWERPSDHVPVVIEFKF